MSRKSVIIVVAVVAVVAAAAGTTVYVRRDRGLTVTTEAVRKRDLEAVVSASGKIQPKRLVNISADTPGRVVNLAVNEGQRVKAGEFLLQIDPKSLKTRVDGESASLQAAELSLDQMRQAIETARVQLQLAQQNLARQQNLYRQQLTTRETLEKATNDVDAAASAVSEREKMIKPQESRVAQERATLESARYDLSKVRIESPIDGIVTRRNIEEGETAVVGTMNNPGTVLLTLADMRVIQAEVEVDETSVPAIQIGQIGKITVDAIPDRSFRGHVTEIGNSPIQTSTTSTGSTASGSTGTQATTFKVVVVLDEPIPDVRPGFTCTADITTATRKSVVAVPIPAVAVRELVFDAAGQVVREPRGDGRHRPSGMEAVAAAQELLPGQTRKETEGVFVLRSGRAEFVPLKTGIAGDKYFEVLAGVNDGEQVITGPFNVVRGMNDGDSVRVDNQKKK